MSSKGHGQERSDITAGTLKIVVEPETFQESADRAVGIGVNPVIRVRRPRVESDRIEETMAALLEFLS